MVLLGASFGQRWRTVYMASMRDEGSSASWHWDHKRIKAPIYGHSTSVAPSWYQLGCWIAPSRASTDVAWLNHLHGSMAPWHASRQLHLRSSSKRVDESNKLTAFFLGSIVVKESSVSGVRMIEQLRLKGRGCYWWWKKNIAKGKYL